MNTFSGNVKYYDNAPKAIYLALPGNNQKIFD